MENNKICIICSLSCKKQCETMVKYFEKLGFEVYHPFMNQRGSLFTIQKGYIEKIKEADIIAAIPKKSYPNQTYHGETVFNIEFGESTSYELALASSLGKPIMFI